MIGLFVACAASSIECYGCQQGCRLIRMGLKEGVPEKIMVKKLYQMCVQSLPQFTKGCNIVYENALDIIEMIQNGADSMTVCRKYGLCFDRSSYSRNSARVPVIEADGVKCEVCKKFISWAVDNLSEVSFKSLHNLINTKCPSIPYLRDFCATITDEQIHEIISLIQNQLQPERVCTWIRLC